MSYSGSACSGEEIHNVGGSSTDEAGRRCAIGFNPSNHAPTDKIKSFCACAMKAVIDERNSMVGKFSNRKEELAGKGQPVPQAEIDGNNDAMRCFATALTQLEHAQMIAVKGLHAPKNAGA